MAWDRLARLDAAFEVTCPAATRRTFSSGLNCNRRQRECTAGAAGIEGGASPAPMGTSQTRRPSMFCASPGG